MRLALRQDGVRQQGPLNADGGAVRGTLLRHLTLFEHRLDPAAAQKLRNSIDQIGAGETEFGRQQELLLASAGSPR